MPVDEDRVVEGSGDVIGSMVRALVAHLERALGADAVPRVVAAAGIAPDDPRLDDDHAWFTADEVARLADAATAATGDAEIGRRAGEQYFRRDQQIGLTDFLEGAGDPGSAITVAVAETARIAPARRTEVVESGDGEVVVDSFPIVDAARHRYHCDLYAGHYVQIPGLFDAVGTVTHARCAARGDDRCRLVLRWLQPSDAPEARLPARRHRAQDLVKRFEELHAVAADLAAVDDLEDALERIVERAGATMLAQRFLATVRDGTGGPPLVSGSGIPHDLAEEAASQLWEEGEGAHIAFDGLGVPIVAPIGEPERVGYLVGVLPPGTSIREADVRLLDAYAGHAAATIHRILTASAARREQRTTAALLGLAHSLGGARTIDEVTALVTDAVGDVTGCTVAGVWLLDRDLTRYELQVVHDQLAHDGPRTIPVPDPAGPADMAADPRPFTVRVGGSDDVDRVLRGWGVEEAYVGPIARQGRIYGLLAAARPSPSEGRDTDAVLAAVSALAHQAAGAIANVELLDEIRHQALHDALTGLPNRPHIEDQAAAALLAAEIKGTSVALAFLDVDRFKIVNDTLGHVAGDQLIGRVAERLEAHLRPSDAVARLGGDEFLVLLTELDGPEQAEEVASRMLDVVREPFEVGGESLFVTASIGLACAPQHGTDYGVLLRRADAAMYVAKGEGRNRLALHRSPAAGRRSRLKLESELHHAAERGELRIRYQPQVDLLTDEIVAVEALVRWQHPTLGLIGPGTFLSIAEESGIVVDIDRWVRRTAFAQAAAWVEAGTPVRVAVNVSRRDLADATFATTVHDLLEELGLPAPLVELEITDRIVMSDEDLPPSLTGLRELGVRLAVDDFGTGSSVLSRLHHCPVDVLKVDRTFVEPLAHPDPDTRLVDGLVSMAHALGMEVVIEGIEDERQARAVRLLGAELAQGFWFHRPLPAEELAPLLQLDASSGPTGFPPVGRRRPRGAHR